jgi:hypothetical protein
MQERSKTNDVVLFEKKGDANCILYDVALVVLWLFVTQQYMLQYILFNIEILERACRRKKDQQGALSRAHSASSTKFNKMMMAAVQYAIIVTDRLLTYAPIRREQDVKWINGITANGNAKLKTTYHSIKKEH